MEQSRNNGGQRPANEQCAALTTLVSLDSMDMFGVPETPTQHETLDNIYSKFVAPQKFVSAPARNATRNVLKRTAGGASPVGSTKQHQTQELNTNLMQSQDASVAGGEMASSPKHIPVWQQQPGWQQGSQDPVPKSPSSAANSQRNASQQSVLARRPRESSLKMKAHIEATAGQQSKEAGRISRAGSAVAAVRQRHQASAVYTVKDQQMEHVDAVQAAG